MEGDKTGRISYEQREAMLTFMEQHSALATGRFTAPDGAKQKKRLLMQLADTLNSLPNGATKTPDKWLKSWQDWRGDTKSKAALLKREMSKTGGGQVSLRAKPRAKPLTPLEEKLMAFLGSPCALGHREILDPSDLGIAGSSVASDVLVLPLEGAPVPLDTPLPLDTSFPLDAPGPSSAPQATVLWTSSHASTPLSSPSLDIPSGDESSRASPWPHVPNIRPVSRGTKRRRPTDSSLSDAEEPEGAQLIGLLEKQVELQAEGNAIQERHRVIQERQCPAIENASVAFGGAMKAMENYFINKTL